MALCRALNDRGAKYVVIGGMAMIQAGFVRGTEDIDLLIDGSAGNQAAVRDALEILPDKAVRELREGDLERYVVVRIADEIVVDLLLSAGGITYAEAASSCTTVVVNTVPIPFASPQLLLRMKQTGGEKDALDLLFLKNLLSHS
ncbi:MAG: hypothetical protein WB626_04760 [Bacteroidota bacterium]